MQVEHRLFDGVKSVPLGALHGDWLEQAEGEAGDELSAAAAYRLVPYLYRAVDLRARAVSALPWSLRDSDGCDVRDDGALRGVVRGMRQRLYLTEAALCLYGAAYWLKESNALGLNLTPRWVVPTSITLRFDRREGLIGYERWCGGGAQQLVCEDVVAFWMPNMVAELGPGVAPVQVALAAARVLHHLDVLLAGYFRRGAIRPTLLSVMGNPSQSEIERLETWARRMWSGIRSAFQIQGVRSEVKTTVVGDGLEQLQSRELTVQQRENVCAALGVPHSMFSADAATYATARQDKLNLLLTTVVPQAQMIEETINDAALLPRGVRFAFHSDQVEELQQYEVEKAQALTALVREGVLRVDEARRLLGYEEGV